MESLVSKLFNGESPPILRSCIHNYGWIQWRARITPASFPRVRTHAPDALRALLSTGAANHFSVVDVKRALRRTECASCGERFGAYLYLLECRRCCWRCLSTSRELLPVVKDAVERLYAVEAWVMDALPSVRSLPGVYGPRYRRRPNVRSKNHKRIELVANGAARKAGGKILKECRLDDDDDDGSELALYEDALLATRIALRGPVELDFMREMDCRNYDPEGYDGGWGLQPQRLMAAVRFPALVRGEVEWGFCCFGCL